MGTEKKSELDLSSLRGLPYAEAKEKINQAFSATIGQSAELKQATGLIAAIDILRQDGLYAYRKAVADHADIQEDHKLATANLKAKQRNAGGALSREFRRRKAAEKIALKGEHKSLRRIRREVGKEFHNASLLARSEPFFDPLKPFASEALAHYPRLFTGLGIVFKLPEEAAIRAMHEPAEAKLVQTIADLKAQLHKVRTMNGNPVTAKELRAGIAAAKVSAFVHRRSEATELSLAAGLATARASYGAEALADAKTRSEADVALLRLAYQAIRCEAELVYARKKTAYPYAIATIRAEHRIARDAQRNRHEQETAALRFAETYYADLKDAAARSAKAKTRMEADKGTIDSKVATALGLIKVFFGGLQAKIDNQARECNDAAARVLKDELVAARGLSSGAEDQVAKKAAKAARRKAAKTAYDKVDWMLSLTAYAQKKVRKLEADYVAKARSDLKPSNKGLAHYDHRIERFYAPSEVSRNPALVDTAVLRLVIKGADEAVSVKTTERRDLVAKAVSKVLVYLFLAVVAIVILFPFYWMLITSLKSNAEIRNTLTPSFYPGQDRYTYDAAGNIISVVRYDVAWSNYIDVFQQFKFGTYLLNTLVVGIFSTLGVLLTCVFSAFAFARLKFTGRDSLFTVFLATMMIPGEMMVITNYLSVANFGWIGSNATRLDAYLAMIVPFCVSVFYIYLLRQNFKQIPEELYLAAKVDGKSDWQFLWAVMVPLCKPTLITIGILELMGSWNAYIWPNLVTDKEEYRLISNGLRNSFMTTVGEPQYGLQMAATVLVTVPLLLLFVFFRKYIMRGVGRAGIKG